MLNAYQAVLPRESCQSQPQNAFQTRLKTWPTHFPPPSLHFGDRVSLGTRDKQILWVRCHHRRLCMSVNCLKMVQNRKIKITYLIVVVFLMRSGCFWGVSSHFWYLPTVKTQKSLETPQKHPNKAWAACGVTWTFQMLSRGFGPLQKRYYFRIPGVKRCAPIFSCNAKGSYFLSQSRPAEIFHKKKPARQKCCISQTVIPWFLCLDGKKNFLFSFSAVCVLCFSARGRGGGKSACGYGLSEVQIR